MCEAYHVRSRKISAFTLIEVMVAMFILAVAGGVVLLGLSLSLSQGKESQERVLAQLLAASVIDELKAHPFGSVKPLAGWTVRGQEFVREQDVPSVVGGLPSPMRFELRVTPLSSSATNLDQASVRVDWVEPSGPASLQFTVPMAKGWNQAVDRGDSPPNVAGNWHDPKPYTIPSEPSYRQGDQDHTVDPSPPDAGDIVSDKTKEYQDLYNQLSRANAQLNADQQAVSDDQTAIDGLKQQISDAQSQKNPDQAAIAALQSQLSDAQSKLAQDQAKVTNDQQTIAGIQQKIDDLDKKNSD